MKIAVAKELLVNEIQLIVKRPKRSLTTRLPTNIGNDLDPKFWRSRYPKEKRGTTKFRRAAILRMVNSGTTFQLLLSNEISGHH
jgi:hypothetical protein